MQLQLFENENIKVSNKVKSLNGKTVCITGTLQAMTRFEAMSMIRELGGFYEMRLNRGVDVLITGYFKNCVEMSCKLNKARVKGIMIMNEESFLELIRGIL
jgi:DNA ligase (NAD+)